MGDRYHAIWTKLHETPELRADDRHAVEARIRGLNDLGFSVDEVELEPAGNGRLRLKLAVTTRRFHARELERLTGISALENQARLLLNDLREYRAWLEWSEGRPLDGNAAQRWLREILKVQSDVSGASQRSYAAQVMRPVRSSIRMHTSRPLWRPAI